MIQHRKQKCNIAKQRTESDPNNPTQLHHCNHLKDQHSEQALTPNTTNTPLFTQIE